MVEGTDKQLDLASADGDAEINKIKEEIVDVRSQMGETIDELQERLSVPAITANIKEEVSEQFASAVDSTKELLYETAGKGLNNIMKNLSALTNMTGGVLPLVLIGAGAGLIVMNRRGSGTNTKDGRSTNGGTVEFAKNQHSLGSTSSGLGIADAASSVYHHVEDAVSSTASKVADVAATGKEKYASYLDENPMAVGAVAAAIGLAVGLALPLTDAENDLLGETAGSIKEHIQDAAKETVGAIKETATEFLDSVDQSSGKAATANRS
ncbi:MAG: DUF3618 domain-containing protein [Pyrinomonadaceae bacterium]